MGIESKTQPGRGFTLIELLIVVAIIAILAAIAIYNMKQAVERALRASDAAKLHAIAVALQSYHVDNNAFPPADREAGPFCSHGPQYKNVGNGPAAGGSWDGLPWLLFRTALRNELGNAVLPEIHETVCGRTKIRGGYRRYHNFRYVTTARRWQRGALGGAGDINTGKVWLVRDQC